MRKMKRILSVMVVLAFSMAIINVASGAGGAHTGDGPSRDLPVFAVGVTGISVATDNGYLTVQSTTADTPAAGCFEAGDVLSSVNGRSLSVEDPRTVLGNAITSAEATNGKLVFNISGGKAVTITIPVMGAYSATWPLECAKSDKIVEQTAAYVMESDLLQKTGLCNSLAALFLLSTGDDSYLPAVRDYARSAGTDVGSHTWNNGYLGILIGEYYLRTGDSKVLPTLKALCDDARDRQYFGGWNHWGSGIGLGYVQGGLMNAAGTQVLTSLILAKECGVDVDQGTFDCALTFFYRFAGHGSNPYGDHRSEGGVGSNGKDGMLVAAYTLLEGENFRKAAEFTALQVADSYTALLAGHTGGGFDVIWRGLASPQVPESKQDHYRRHLEKLRWFYDLSRLPAGGFAMAGAQRYAGPVWGTGGMGLAYTAPRKTLRITGGAPTKYSNKVEIPTNVWGKASDVAFLNADFAEGGGASGLEPHEVFDRVGSAYGDATEVPTRAWLVKTMRHYLPMPRTKAAQALATMGAVDEIVAALQDKDARVRRAGLDAISGYGFWSGGKKRTYEAATVSKSFLPYIVAILNNPGSSLWEIDGALLALSMAEAKDVAKQGDLIKSYLTHEEWWLRQQAGQALMALQTDAKLFALHVPVLIEYLLTEQHIMALRTIKGDLRTILTDKESPDDVKLMAADIIYKATKQVEISEDPRWAVAGVGKINEMTRYLGLAENPERIIPILKDIERVTPRLNVLALGWLVMGDKWGNPGLLRCYDQLGPEKGTAVKETLKNIIPVLKGERSLSRSKRDADILGEAIQETLRRVDDKYAWVYLSQISKDDPQEWQYYTWNATEPPKLTAQGSGRLQKVALPAELANWYTDEFDSAAWKKGAAPFGIWTDLFQYLVEDLNTEFTDERILMRKSFEVNEKQIELPVLQLLLLSREAVDVYLNGKLVYTSEESMSRPRYKSIVLDDDALAALRKGTNVIAVRTRINHHMKKPYGLVDAGLRIGANIEM